MKNPRTSKIHFQPIVSGQWKAELVGRGSVQLGGATNLTPHPHAIEFSWILKPIVVKLDRSSLFRPGVLMLMAPSEPIEHRSPGRLIENSMSACLDLVVSRPQFTDLLSIFKGEHPREISFSLDEKIDDDSWLVSSWSLNMELPN